MPQMLPVDGTPSTQNLPGSRERRTQTVNLRFANEHGSAIQIGQLLVGNAQFLNNFRRYLAGDQVVVDLQTLEPKATEADRTLPLSGYRWAKSSQKR